MSSLEWLFTNVPPSPRWQTCEAFLAISSVHLSSLDGTSTIINLALQMEKKHYLIPLAYILGINHYINTVFLQPTWITKKCLDQFPCNEITFLDTFLVGMVLSPPGSPSKILSYVWDTCKKQKATSQKIKKFGPNSFCKEGYMTWVPAKPAQLPVCIYLNVYLGTTKSN